MGGKPPFFLKEIKRKQKLLTQRLLEWYKDYGRTLPWRVKEGAHPDPYVVLVSEFMLQQTTVNSVIPYFFRFMKRFPNIQDLAQASLEEVYQLWQGLGYYNRARSLHETAKIITQNGKFPTSKEDVSKLKGFGTYTTSSYLALAYNQPETVVDGNVTRIICRLYHLTSPISEIKHEIFQKAKELTSITHSADYASAIMDLGAIICTPKSPKCLLCPWQRNCLSQGQHDLEQIPFRPSKPKSEKQGCVYIIQNPQGEVLIRKRTEKGLLSGLYEFPWSDNGELKDYEKNAKDTKKTVSHQFSHFKLILKIKTIRHENKATKELFVAPETLKNYPFSTLMKKVWKEANSNV